MAGRILILTDKESDLSALLAQCFDAATVLSLDEATEEDIAGYGAVAVLGGTDAYGATLLPPLRQALERCREKNTRVFCEYTRGAGEACFSEVVETLQTRPVLMDNRLCPALKLGSIFDEQCNTRLPVQYLPPSAVSLLQYVPNPDGFYQASVPERAANTSALFLETPTLLMCTFRLSNFAKARFAPQKAWCALLCGIVSWLGGHCTESVVRDFLRESYHLTLNSSISACAKRALNWFEGADMRVFYKGLPYAMLEGVSSSIDADGRQRRASQRRTDCAGECALMYALWHRLTGEAWAKDASEGLYQMVRQMQVKAGAQKGMVRGSLGWWGNASYQDDAARGFLLPLLFRTLLTGDHQDDERLRSALDYLLKATGKDGLRPNQINYMDPEGEEVLSVQMYFRDGKWRRGGFEKTTCEALRAQNVNSPSAHYNAFYHAALLLGSFVLGDEKYLSAGEKGLSTLMAAYPNTAREHSQTQEMCRLLMPLSALYFVTKKPQHKAWLTQVSDDLQRFCHESGGYREVDEGYLASCSRSAKGECSVFSHNGDPVCDFLYSMNWLPMAYAAAYYATKEEKYRQLWKQTTAFICKAQLASKNPLLDGAWARAVDMDAMEVYGVNNDREWSVWTIESGWTVAEITSGLILGQLLGLS